jgi:hypothetical protein
MPQTPESNDGGVSKKVASAKKALDRAWNSNVSGQRPPAKEPKVVDKTINLPEKKPASPYEGLLHPQIGDSVHGVEERNRQAEGVKDVLAPQKMHDGGKVKESGVKDLEKGETVLPKDKDKAERLAMKHLGKKAKGVMSEAVEEEESEPKAEEKHETKKEEKAEGHKEAEKKPKVEKGKRSHTTVIHHHKTGHTMLHLREDGSHDTHQFALGDHAAMGSNMKDMLESQSEDPSASGAGAGGGQGGASPEPAAL